MSPSIGCGVWVLALRPGRHRVCLRCPCPSIMPPLTSPPGEWTAAEAALLAQARELAPTLRERAAAQLPRRAVRRQGRGSADLMANLKVIYNCSQSDSTALKS